MDENNSAWSKLNAIPFSAKFINRNSDIICQKSLAYSEVTLDAKNQKARNSNIKSFENFKAEPLRQFTTDYAQIQLGASIFAVKLTSNRMPAVSRVFHASVN